MATDYFSGNGGGGGLPDGYAVTLAMPGRALGGAVSNVGEMIAQAIEKRKLDSQKATMLRKTLAVLDPENKDQYNILGLPEAEGALQGLMLKQAQEQRQAEQRRRDDLAAAELAQYRQQQQADQELAGAMQTAGEGAPMLTGEPGSRFQEMTAQPVAPTMERFSGAVAALHPNAVNARNFNEVTRALAEQQLGGAPQILPGPYPGTSIVSDFRGRGMPQIVYDPQAAANLLDLKTSTGEHVGYGIPGRGGLTQFKQPGQVTDRDLFTANARRMDTITKELKTVGTDTQKLLQAELEQLKADQEALKAGTGARTGVRAISAENPRSPGPLQKMINKAMAGRRRYVYENVNGKPTLKE